MKVIADDPVRVFVGFDPREASAYHVCCQSIISRASRPVSLHPLALNMFAADYTESHKDGSNAFIYSRFLVPWLCRWEGYAIFVDGDMIVRDDIVKLWDRRPIYQGVSVVKHDYKTKHPVKYLGNANADYPRKNWSSVILWNCGFFPNRKLTPEYVSKSTGSHLHRFQWLGDQQIDELPAEWNHLVAEYAPNPAAKLLHYTIGLPAFAGYEQPEGDPWRAELKEAMTPCS